MNLNRELPQSSVASGHKYEEMQFYHTGTFDQNSFHYTRAHSLYEASVAKIFVQLGPSASHSVSQLNKIMTKVYFLEIYAVFNFGSNLVEYLSVYQSIQDFFDFKVSRHFESYSFRGI